MSTYNITITDNGSGVFTPLIRRGGTPASGGTVLTGGGSNLASAATTTQLGNAIETAKLISENDRAAGN